VRHWLARSDLQVAAALVVWSVAPMVALLIVSNGTLTGAETLFAPDQLQYLAWTREAADHWLISNTMDLAPSGRVFLHPMFVLSGLASRTGVGVEAAYLLWKPVALLVLLLGFRAYVARLLPDGWERRAALLIALFYFAPLVPILDWLEAVGDSAQRELGLISGELVAANLLVGYYPTAIALGLMGPFLLAIERLLEPAHRAPRRGAYWYAGWASACGLAVSWLHPWQGEILLLVMGGALAWRGLRPRELALASAPALATLAPLAYYLLLSRTDSAWELAQRQNEFPLVSPWVVVVALLPVAVLALFAVRLRGLAVGRQMLLLWPVAALAVYVLISPSSSYHAFQGMSLPLAILGMEGWRRVPASGAMAVAGVALVTLLGAGATVDLYKRNVDGGGAVYALRDEERRALDHLERLQAGGGVLAPGYISPVVAPRTGRSTWVAHPSWTPAYGVRLAQTDALFAGALGGPAARSFVRATGARFLLSDCRDRADLRPALGAMLVRTRAFGCAAVYELAPSRTWSGGPRSGNGISTRSKSRGTIVRSNSALASSRTSPPP